MASKQETKHELTLEEEEEEEEEELSHEFKTLLPCLPKEGGWRTRHLYQYQGHWCQAKQTQAIISFQKHFQAQDTDIILSSVPRSGTIWLKSAAFAIINREHFKLPNHPLLTSDPHILVPCFEYKIYANDKNIPDLSGIPPPRLFSTHVAFPLLPDSIKNTNSKIVYVSRNPFDNFVSLWVLIVKMRPESLGPFPSEEAFDMYCRGLTPFGPYLDHMLGYWKESRKSHRKVLFLKYEEMKEDIVSQMKRVAEFLGYPFSLEEERDGVVEEISRLCSFQKLKESEAKHERREEGYENLKMLRKGVVGDWVNYLTPSMVDRMSKLMEEKLKGSGLEFKVAQQGNIIGDCTNNTDNILLHLSQNE